MLIAYYYNNHTFEIWPVFSGKQWNVWSFSRKTAEKIIFLSVVHTCTIVDQNIFFEVSWGENIGRVADVPDERMKQDDQMWLSKSRKVCWISMN